MEARLTQALNPFEDVRPTPFATGYRKGSGKGPVYGGLAAAVLTGFLAAYWAQPGLLRPDVRGARHVVPLFPAGGDEAPATGDQ